MADRAAILASLSLCGALLVHSAAAEPIATRNQSPLVAPFGLPAPLPARLPSPGPGRATLTSNWGNSASIDGPDDNLVIDAETVELRLSYERTIRERFAVHIALPWRSTGSGTLDGLVESWHDLLGLPDGDRSDLPRDGLLVRYAAADNVLLNFDQPGSGMADVPLAGGFQLYASERNAVAAWLTVKLPVGDAERLTGSGATDLALSLAGQSELADRWQLFGQLDTVWLGRGNLLPDLQKRLVWSALAGLTWNAWRGLDLTVQLQANSALFDASATGLSAAATVLTFGGRYRTAGDWSFDLAISEDLDVGASPDAVFHFGLARQF